MAIPAIAPYPMPGEEGLPENRVEWTPDPRRALLLVHDMQNYFVSAFTQGASPMSDLVANVSALRETAGRLGVPVVYSAQPGGQTRTQRGLLQDFWGAGIGPEPGAQEIIPALAPGPDDVHLVKWRYSAFHRTRLRELMTETGRDQLVVTGIYAHIGCLMTACDAFMSDTQVFFVADAVADFSAEHHGMALTYAAERCAMVLTTRRLNERLTTAATVVAH
ncbi:isochorismatase family protein [Streptosporangium sp. NPDC000239]|uniref:isochorismatase family protein n=1 Tax=unclassified Streptosporangium TaxID=2632669 RepID=UPI0033239281